MWNRFLKHRPSETPAPAEEPRPLNAIVNFLARRGDADEGFVVNTKRLGTHQFEYHTFSKVSPGEVLQLKIVSGPTVLDVKAAVLTASVPTALHQTGIMSFTDLTTHDRKAISRIIQKFRVCLA